MRNFGKQLGQALLGLSVSSHAWAAWSSGGGELIKDANNPWFIQNTKEVHYCLLQDQDVFHVEPEQLEKAVTAAFDYWKNEFALTSPHAWPGSAKVGTQEFKRVSCSGSTDLVFQFGLLNSEQLHHIKDPTRYVSLAMRTSYDPVQMRGKGFIYVAADSGPLKPKGRHLAERPWSMGKGGLLIKVLTHELGHVFGVLHTDEVNSLMRPEYPEKILDAKPAPYVEPQPIMPTLPRDFTEVNTILSKSCDLDEESPYHEFFGIPSNWTCFEISTNAGLVEVRAGKASLDKLELIGTATYKGGFVHYVQPIGFWVPEVQKVDKNLGAPVYKGKKTNQAFTYQSRDGSISRALFISQPIPGEYYLSGVLNGELTWLYTAVAEQAR